MRKLILASASRYRQTQLQGLGLLFDCQPANIDETPLAAESPTDTALRLALYKAKQVAQAHPEALVIGCDQTGDLEGLLLGKPLSHDKAVEQLRAMAGKTVLFHSAVAVVGPTGHWQTNVTTRVQMRPLRNAEIENYLHRDQPYDCAGSFKIEAAGPLLMSSVSSDDPSALIGLPLIALTELLRKAGVDPLQ